MARIYLEDKPSKSELRNACFKFLKNCNGGKNNDASFYGIPIWNIAELKGIVVCTGNYKWDLSDNINKEIDAVLLKYAKQIADGIE